MVSEGNELPTLEEVSEMTDAEVEGKQLPIKCAVLAFWQS